ncbi:hypothetical protein M8C21_006995 [Ambrosia artemisiifolia]|uniref:Uncharacterized protein n=1 Tax=Ambrosia artemisiifolia TaxID=4212 RepID=A0AAD5CMI9_AMBAR|nr:hypothetical protein M8C21_006995 [Ambrosia artemisiifolia]
MATKCSIAPDVVWNWVIEALASSEQVDISTLIDLVKLAPAISGDAGKDTREIVSLRVLESLFDHGNEATVDGKTPKVSFDPSERCEDVLKKILHERTPEQMTKLEKEKWDVGPFLKHKRSSLPKCVLNKLKEAILDDSNPLLASLKEKSNLVTSNASDDTSPTNGEIPLNPSKDKSTFQENALQDDNVPQDTYTEGRNERVSVDSMENLEFGVKSKDSNNIAQPNNERVNDDNDDERTDVNAKKEAFLKSQCTISQDSLTLTEWSEIDRCMKCNESGEFLLCSSDSCQLRFHESCLGSAVTLEENGEFFCPFCAYSRAISKYQEAKRNASLAKKNLQAFFNFKAKPRPTKSSTKQGELEGNEDIQMEENNNNCMSNEKDSFQLQPDPIIPDVNVNDDDDDPSLGQTTELPQNPIPEPTTPKQKSKEKESQRSTESSLTIRLRKRKAKHTPPPVPVLRRRKLPWTKSEEETLKEGVERYSSGNNTKIPWKEILDFGHNVFHKGRTAIDLKDKWRNICK